MPVQASADDHGEPPLTSSSVRDGGPGISTPESPCARRPHRRAPDRSAQNPASVVLLMKRLMWLKHLGEGFHSPQARVLFVAEELRVAVHRRQASVRWCDRRGGAPWIGFLSACRPMTAG